MSTLSDSHGPSVEEASGKHAPGFQMLLRRIQERIVPGMALGDALHEILTFGGRQTIEEGVASLTPLQHALMTCGSDLHLRAPNNDADTRTWYLGLWTYGRVWLAHEKPLDPDCWSLAAVTVPEAVEAALSEHAARLHEEAHRGDAEMTLFYDQLDADGLARVLHEVHEAIDHTDPVLLYIGDDTLTNFGKFNNLQSRGPADLPQCFHRRAIGLSSNDWSHSERVYVFCVYMLRIAGCRVEEFCGRQLNPEALRIHLERRVLQYREFVQGIESSPGSIADMARLLARLKHDAATRVLTFRRINGLTFRKEERLRTAADPERGTAGMPDALRTCIAELCGVDAASYADLPALFDACVARTAQSERSAAPNGMTSVEALLAAMVESAIEETRSDFGMTRGTRDMARLQRALSERQFETICDWPAVDYYCAVFPSEAMRTKFADNPDDLVRILYACSARMQFNHWHYMPGHCPRERVPQGRHFYLPPSMPDIAVWADQHHAGHVLARVRHSIRSPAPVVLGGLSYPGLVDLRLFRQQGQPYSEAELATALKFTEYVRALHQSLSTYIERGGVPVRVDAFDKDWYRGQYGKASPARANVATATPIEATTPEPHKLGNEQMLSTDLFEILCRQSGDGVALIEARQSFPDVKITYRDLAMTALSLHCAMRRHGLGPGSCIAVLSERPLHQATAIICGMACGLIVHPLNPKLSDATLSAQLEHSEPAWLIVDGSVRAPEQRLTGMRCVAWEDAFVSNVGNVDATIRKHAEPPRRKRQDRLVDPGGLLIHTSGTTGHAKGVLLSWRHLAANVRRAIFLLGYEPGWIAGSLLPRFHTFTLVSDLFASLLVGGTTVLADSFDLRNVKRTVDAFIAHGVQSYSAAPVILEALCSLRAWSNAPALRFAVAGAAPLKESTRLAYSREFGHPIVPCYGLSETTCFATVSPRDAIRPGSAGLPAGIEVRVVDESGALLGRDTAGELVVRGPSVIGSYYRDDSGQFSDAFDADGWFRTGDIGHIDEDGYVYVTGRKKNMVIRGGEKIYLEDVDRCLTGLLGVVDSASIALCQAGKPDQALTFIVTPGASLPRTEIEAHIRAALTAQHVPDRIYFVGCIPRTPSGKASHPELMALAVAQGTSEEPA